MENSSKIKEFKCPVEGHNERISNIALYSNEIGLDM